MSYEIEPTEALLAAADQLGFAVATVDLTGVGERDEALARVAAALRFPDWFGGTWDSLSDCLRDMSWWPARGYVVVIRGGELSADERRVLSDVFDEAAVAWLWEGIPFWPFLV